MSRYAHSVRAIFGCILDGICDSLRLPSTLIFFLSSVTVRVRTAHCIVLNGFIFLGSILIADWMMVPIIRTILAIGGIAQQGSTEDTINMPLASASIPLPSGEDQSIGEWINVIFLYAYQVREHTTRHNDQTMGRAKPDVCSSRRSYMAHFLSLPLSPSVSYSGSIPSTRSPSFSMRSGIKILPMPVSISPIVIPHKRNRSPFRSGLQQ